MRKSPTSRAAFSLVEVTLSIGIMAFTMIPLVALLGGGLQAGREAQEQNQSGRLMTLAAQSVASAVLQSSGQWEAADPLSGLLWDGGAGFSGGPLYFDSELRPMAAAANAHYVLYLRSEAPATGEMRRVALVLAWPAPAVVTWESGRAKVTGGAGHLQNVIHLSER